MDPKCEYDYICELIKTIDLHESGAKSITAEDNELIVDAFDIADRIFHSRIMSLHDYHVETKKMVDSCNGVQKDYRANLVLRLGAVKRRAA